MKFKPRLRAYPSLLQDGTTYWVCRIGQLGFASGIGLTPKAAYEDWLRLGWCAI